MLETYKSPNLDQLHDWARREAEVSNYRVAGVYGGILALGYNTEVFERRKLPVPKCWAELTNPVYKGEVMLSNPNSSGTAYMMLASLVQVFGEDEAFRYMKALNANVNQYARSGIGPMTAVTRGETGIGSTVLHGVINEIVRGFPVKAILPCEGVGYEVGSMAIIKGARNLDNAKKFFDWALTAEAQQIGLDVKEYAIPTNRNVKLAAAGSESRRHQADQLRQRQVRLDRRAQAPAGTLGEGNQRGGEMRFESQRARVLAAPSAPSGFCCVPWYALEASVLSAAWLSRFHRQEQCAGAGAGMAAWPHLAAAQRRTAARQRVLLSHRLERGVRAHALLILGAAGLPVHLRPGLRHRRAGLVLRRAGPCLGPACRQPARHGPRRGADALRIRDAVRARARRARVLQRRRVHRRLHRGDPRVDGDLHVLPGPNIMVSAFQDDGGAFSLVSVPRARDAAEGLGSGLPDRRAPLRRRLEHAAARADLRRRDDRTRPRVRAGGRAHELPLQEAAARDVDPADHHAAVRHRSGADPALRSLRRAQPLPGVEPGHRAVALVLWLARTHPGATAFVHADRIPGADRRGRRRFAQHGRSGANAARESLAHLRRRVAAADAAGARQRVPDRLHRIDRRLRQSDRARRQFRRAGHRGLLLGRRRAARPGPRRGAWPAAAGIRARRILRAALGARTQGIYGAVRQGRLGTADAPARKRAQDLLCGGGALDHPDAGDLRHGRGRRLRRAMGAQLHAYAQALHQGLRRRVGRERPALGRHRLEPRSGRRSSCPRSPRRSPPCSAC